MFTPNERDHQRPSMESGEYSAANTWNVAFKGNKATQYGLAHQLNAGKSYIWAV